MRPRGPINSSVNVLYPRSSPRLKSLRVPTESSLRIDLGDLDFYRSQLPQLLRLEIEPKRRGTDNRGCGSESSRGDLQELLTPMFSFVRIVKPIFFEQRKNLCFNDAAIPAGVVFEPLGRHEETMSYPISGSEIGSILADGLIN